MDSLRFSEGLLVLREDDDRAATAMASESTLFKARRADRDGEVQLLLQQQAQLSEQAAGFEAILASSNTLMSSLDTEIADLSELLRDGYVDKQRLRELGVLEAGFWAKLRKLNLKLPRQMWRLLSRNYKYSVK